MLVDLERVGPPPGPVEGEHQLRPELLAQRLVSDQAGQFRDDVGVQAGRQVGVDALAQYGQPPLVQPGRLTVQRRHVAQVGQRGTTPQRQRVAQDPAGLGPLARGQGPPAPDGERLEPLRVQLVRPHQQGVAAAPVLVSLVDDLAPGVAEGADG